MQCPILKIFLFISIFLPPPLYSSSAIVTYSFFPQILWLKPSLQKSLPSHSIIPSPETSLAFNFLKKFFPFSFPFFFLKKRQKLGSNCNCLNSFSNKSGTKELQMGKVSWKKCDSNWICKFIAKNCLLSLPITFELNLIVIIFWKYRYFLLLSLFLLIVTMFFKWAFSCYYHDSNQIFWFIVKKYLLSPFCFLCFLKCPDSKVSAYQFYGYFSTPF